MQANSYDYYHFFGIAYNLMNINILSFKNEGFYAGFYCWDISELLHLRSMQIPGYATELTGYFTWMGKDGIARTRVKPDTDITLEHAVENSKFVNSLYVDGKFPLLIDARGIKSMSYEARHHFSVRGRKTNTCAFGIIIGSAISRVLGNFYLGINKPTVPTKLFDKEAAAVEWLKQFLD
jgi:hypothetical protein